jgi:hypothetical protein
VPAVRTLPRRRYASPRVVRLIDRIRGLVAERRRLERDGDCGPAEALGRQIARLQEQLANVVRAELAQPQT